MAQEIYHRSNWGNPTETWGNSYLNADLTNELYKRASEYENSWVTDQLLNGVGTKPSIILTPTAYEDGVLNSVKPAKTFGSELVTNGTFDTDLSGWTNSNNHWQWTSQGAYFPLISTHNPLTQWLTNPVGVKLKITFTLNIIQGTAQIYYDNINNSSVSTQYTESGTYTIKTELVKQNTDINFSRYGGINTEFYLDNVSVKEVTDADFDFTRGSSATRVNEKGLVQDVQLLSGELVQNGDFEQIGSELVTNGGFDTDTGWVLTGSVIEDGVLKLNGTSGTVRGRQDINFTGQAKVTYTISYNNSSQTTIQLREYGGANTELIPATIGTYTVYKNFATDGVSFQSAAFQEGEEIHIDNVSVKEVGQNWTFGTGWSIAEINGNQVVEFDGGADAAIQQGSLLTSGKKYRLSIDVANKTTGSLQIRFGNTGVVDETITTNGTFTYDLVSDGTTLYLRSIAGFDGYIDNVSVVEITDDTDLPRINYTDGEGSLLLEPQSTNLVTYSEDFSDSSWNKEGGAIIQSNIDISPNGSINASYLKAPVTTNNTVRVTYTFSSTASQTYVGSVFVKKQNVDFIRILSTGATSSTLQAFYNVSNGTLGTSGTPSKATIEDYGNGWYRLNLIIDAVNTSSGATFRVQLAKTDGAVINDFDGTEKNLIWGAQLEELSYATSYIPTNGSTVTRLADVCNNSGSSDLINSTSGVLYAEISALADDGTSRRISISDGSISNRVSIEIDETAGRLKLFVDGQVLQVDNVELLDYNKIAGKYKANDYALWVNGSEVAVIQYSSNVPTGLDSLSFDGGDGNNDFYGNVKCVAVFKEALSDTELEKLTTI